MLSIWDLSIFEKSSGFGWFPGVLLWSGANQSSSQSRPTGVYCAIPAQPRWAAAGLATVCRYTARVGVSARSGPKCVDTSLSLALVLAWSRTKNESACSPWDVSDLRRSHGDLRRPHGNLRRLHGDLRRLHGDLRRPHGELKRPRGNLRRLHGDICGDLSDLQLWPTLLTKCVRPGSVWPLILSVKTTISGDGHAKAGPTVGPYCVQSAQTVYSRPRLRTAGPACVWEVSGKPQGNFREIFAISADLVFSLAVSP